VLALVLVLGPMPTTAAYLGSSPLIVMKMRKPAPRKNAMVDDWGIASHTYFRERRCACSWVLNADEIGDDEDDDD
jgi:hypothetical protein